MFTHKKYVEDTYQIQREIDDLLERQSDALHSATFLGMSNEEALEYDGRRSRIKELIRELFHLDAA